MSSAASTRTSPRLVLIGGPGGAGTSYATAALADRLAGSGLRVAVAALDAWHGASARASNPDLDVLPAASADGVAPAAALLDRVGLDPRLATEVAGLPGADAIEILHRLEVAAARSDLDAVLVDLGSRLVDVVALADRLPWLAAHLLRAQRGWLSATRPRAASLIGRWPGVDGHRSAIRMAERVSEWAATVRAAEVVLVGDEGDPRTRRLGLGLGLHEAAVGDVVPSEEVASWDALPDPAQPTAATLTEHGDGWAWRIDLPGLRSEELRVARSGDDLALDVLGVRRLVGLPTALRRFHTAGARLVAGQLEITFRPKESTT